MLTYAEIHYRPSFVPSLLFKRWPEIVCDAPCRVVPGRPVPVFIIIKDAHKFPVRLEMVVVHIEYENGSQRVARFPYGGVTVNDQIWWDSINIMPEFEGTATISLNILVRKGKKLERIGVDNYRGLSHSPLTVTIASSPFPGGNDWYHGDIHCHTYHTSDQVEFGAPLEVMAYAAFCMGHHWIAATDHSYDLDDRFDNYHESDPHLAKWQIMKKQAEMMSSSITVIAGEEVSCRTGRGKNCHMLALGHERFIKGSGDSGENGLDTVSERTVVEAVRECVEWNGIACAAHPLENVPLFERLILNRGEWTPEDLETTGLTGIQFHNGLHDSGFKRGKEAWIRLLLKGRKISAFGGSDAHGDLNRRRHIVFPFLAVGEDISHRFGSVRTAVRASSRQLDEIKGGLSAGRVVVTEGPFIDMAVSGGTSAVGIGDTFSGNHGTVQALCTSSAEFGALKSGRILAGAAGGSEEKILARFENASSKYAMILGKEERFDTFSYVRAECETVTGKYCFTNPVWVGNRD